MVHRYFIGIANRSLTGMPFTTYDQDNAPSGSCTYGGDGSSIDVTCVSLTDPSTIWDGDGLDTLPLLKD